MKEKCRAAEVASVNQIEVHALADNPLDRCARRPDQIGRQLQHRVLVELGVEPILRQFNSVPSYSWEPNLERISFRPHRSYVNSSSRRLWRDHNWLRGKVEGYSQDIRVLDIKPSRLHSGRRIADVVHDQLPARKAIAFRRRERPIRE